MKNDNLLLDWYSPSKKDTKTHKQEKATQVNKRKNKSN